MRLLLPLLLLGLLPGSTLNDPRTIWYSRHTLPPVYESEGRIFHVGHNLAGDRDKTGSANNEHPWLHTGGFDDCGSEVTVKRLLWMPDGAKIVLTTEQDITDNGFAFSRVAGKYPEGTVSSEYVFDGIRLCMERTRRKLDGEWRGSQKLYGEQPEGYVAVNNCVECHEDIGKHSFGLDGKREWYGTVRGLEPGGPIHWHPWIWSATRTTGRDMLVRDEVAHLIDDQR